MFRLARLCGAVGILIVLLTTLLSTSAFAHERRLVGGTYQFVVGFLNEPTIQGELNGIDLTITTAAGHKPVVGAEKTLKAEVIVGGNAKVMPLDLEPASDENPDSGKYAAYFIPTIPGSYIFHFTGTIDGTPIDERFESGPGRFDDVQAAQPLQFPDKLPDAQATASEIKAAQDQAASARTIAIAAVAVAVVALAFGGVSIVSGRR